MEKNAEVQLFLERLFGAYFKNHKGYIELRFINKTSGVSQSSFFQPDELDDKVFAEIKKKNITSNVYFGVNPRPLSKKKKQDDIKDVVCLWADVDGKDFEGGKEAALLKINQFEIIPNIIVDSGNGYHCYWILREPLIDVDEEQRVEFKQILSELIEKLGADKHAVNLDRVLRLPGTYNIKGDEPIECRVEKVMTDKMYCLEDFIQFKDKDFDESKMNIDDMPNFGSKELIISCESLEAAKKDVGRLEIKPKYKKMILTGSKLTGEKSDKSRSGRDMSIICALIVNDYNYATIRGIFFNQYLGCSDRVLEKGEDKLKWDVINALKLLKSHEDKLPIGQTNILSIKKSELRAEEKRIAINKYIIDDLLSGEKPLGRGFRDIDRNIFYFFDSAEKLLMDIEGIDFYCFLRERFGIAKKEKDEIIDAIKTEIRRKKKIIHAHNFAYYDNQNFILYVCNHANEIFRLDGHKIELLENGTDGVFFEYNSDYSPTEVDVSNLKGANYFEREVETDITIDNMQIKGKTRRYGFSWKKFYNEKSYLCKYLIDRASFVVEEEYNLSPLDQKFLLLTYFYSLFFENIQLEKPILCFVGSKHSGKSFIAETIGKILFGDKYQIRHVPNNTRDLKTIIGTNYYLAFDNLDRHVNNDILDIFCVAATGGTVERRQLYTDRQIVKIRPQVFLVITTREAKFKRDDLVSRLLIFNTKKIQNPKSKSVMFQALKQDRNKIMEEVLINLNIIVNLLRRLKDYTPSGVSRIADWELFGKKIHTSLPELFQFRWILDKMNEQKDRFTIEDDPLYQVLEDTVIEKGEIIEDLSTGELYSLLCDKAIELNMKYFQRKYRSPISLGKRINNIKDELSRVFEVGINKKGSGNRTFYSFAPRQYEEEIDKIDPSSVEEEIEPGSSG